jgi:hypothetical protein
MFRTIFVGGNVFMTQDWFEPIRRERARKLDPRIPPQEQQPREPEPRTSPTSRSSRDTAVIQEMEPETKKRVVPFLDPSLHGAGVTVIQLGAGQGDEKKTLPPGFESPPSAYPGTTGTEISMSPERISQIQTGLHKEMPEKRYFVGSDPATGESIYLEESPYQKTFGYTPRDPDYSTIEKGIASDKETTTDFLTQMSEMFPKATENITTIQQQLKMVEGTPEGTMFKIGEGDVFDISKTEAKEYLIEALVANQEVIKSSQYVPGMKKQLESIEETEFTVGMFKKLGYEVDIAETRVGGQVYSFGLPKASVVHESIYGDVSGIQLGMAGLMQSPFGIGTLADVTTSFITGDPTAKQRRYEETAEYSLGLSKSIKEGDFLPHVLISPAMVSGVYVPALTIGAGYMLTGAVSGSSQVVSGLGGKISPLIQKFTPAGQQIIGKVTEAASIVSQPLITTGKAAGHIMGTRVGEALMTGGLYAMIEAPHLAELAASDPSRIPSRLAESAFGWGMAIGGFKLGAKAYATEFPRQQILSGTKGSPRNIFVKYGSYERNIPSYHKYPGMFDSKPPSLFERVKSSVFEPSSFEYRQLYGLTGMERSGILVRGRTPYGASHDITTLEQIMGKRPDPFMSYTPSKWGGYDTSWSFYRQSLIGEPLKRIPQTTRVPYKVYDGQTVMFKGEFAGKKSLKELMLADVNKPHPFLPGRDGEIVDVGYNIKTRFGYPRFESQQKPPVSIKTDYPLFESQVGHVKKFSEVTFGVDTSSMSSKTFSKYFRYLSKPLDAGVVVKSGQSGLRIVYEPSGKVTSIVTRPGMSTGIPSAWKGVYDVPVSSMVHMGKWLHTVFNVAAITDVLQGTRKDEFLGVVSVPGVKSVFDYRVKVDTMKKSKHSFDLKHLPMVDVASLTASVLGSASLSVQRQDIVQRQVSKQVLNVGLVQKALTVQEISTVTAGGGDYVFDPFISIPPPIFIFDLGMPSFEGLDDYAGKPGKGRKYRRKTHSVELIERIL